jgi:hypothetical protein
MVGERRQSSVASCGATDWLVSRRYLSEASMADLATNPTTGKELQVA